MKSLTVNLKKTGLVRRVRGQCLQGKVLTHQECRNVATGSLAQSESDFLLQGGISNILEELVVQPLLVSVSALTLATETVRSILKIDDVVSSVCIVFFFYKRQNLWKHKLHNQLLHSTSFLLYMLFIPFGHLIAGLLLVYWHKQRTLKQD